MRLLLFIALWATPAVAHDFWIEPQPSSGDSRGLVLRVGDQFKGDVYPFNPDHLLSFGWEASEKPRQQIVAPTGSKIVGSVPTDQLIVVHYQSVFTPIELSRKRYIHYLTEEDYLTELNIPAQQKVFNERYARYAKSLLAPTGQLPRDHRVGMACELELVTTKPEAKGWRLHWRTNCDGKPLAKRWVSLWHDGRRVARIKTDARGEVSLYAPAGGSYMVRLLDLKKHPDPQVDFQGRWLSSTFRLPEKG